MAEHVHVHPPEELTEGSRFCGSRHTDAALRSPTVGRRADRNGNEVTATDDETVERYDEAVDSLLRFGDDVMDRWEATVADEPDFAMGHVGRSYLRSISTERPFATRRRKGSTASTTSIVGAKRPRRATPCSARCTSDASAPSSASRSRRGSRDDPLNTDRSPPSPLFVEEYRPAHEREAARLEHIAEVDYRAGVDATENTDDYVFITVLLAAVLFFAGMSLRFRWSKMRMAVLGLATVFLVFGMFEVLRLPAH